MTVLVFLWGIYGNATHALLELQSHFNHLVSLLLARHTKHGKYFLHMPQWFATFILSSVRLSDLTHYVQ